MKLQNGMFHVYDEPFVDTEWDEAMQADEKPIYYKCGMLNGGTTYKMYKPSVANLVMKRIGVRMEPVG